MRFTRVTLQNFRNIELQSIEFEGTNAFLIGQNGQGKTNLLEALGMVTALRSFRSQDMKALIAHGAKEAQVRYEFEHENEGEVELLIKLKSGGKEVFWNGEPIKKFGELVGRLPTVVLSSEDMHLLRGAPGLRRRFIDLTLAAMDAGYYTSLRRYHGALHERNILLRQKGKDIDSVLDAYEGVMAKESAVIYEKRRVGMEELSKVLIGTYAQMCAVDEVPELLYKADCHSSWAKVLKENRPKDKLFGSTQRGVHRDDLLFKLKNKPAKQYGSEGQQRGLVVALRLAQVQYFSQKSGLKPVILADDVLGQLDEQRRAGFWSVLAEGLQVIATGTELPNVQINRDWEVISVNGGAFTLMNAPLISAGLEV